jgi:hypothetical protein
VRHRPTSFFDSRNYRSEPIEGQIPKQNKSESNGLKLLFYNAGLKYARLFRSRRTERICGCGFQDHHPERYCRRGNSGKNSYWDFFFNCLVSPEKYTTGYAYFDTRVSLEKLGFDTRVSLEKLGEFFSVEYNRSGFRAGVIKRALEHYAATGVQIINPAMTTFRAFYAHEAESFFAAGEIEWEKPRDAWWDDSWFRFKGGSMSAPLDIFHKAKQGTVELRLPYTNVASLKQVLEHWSHDLEIIAKQTGKRAFRLHSAQTNPHLRLQRPSCGHADRAASLPVRPRPSSFCQEM